ncbi:MAG: hypothetical protein ABI045_06370 [Flavobacteriales bacterium]
MMYKLDKDPYPLCSFVHAGYGSMEYAMCILINGEIEIPENLVKHLRLMFHEAVYS